MKSYADTGFLISLYLPETISKTAEQLLEKLTDPLPLIPLTLLELRNALNFAINRTCITKIERDSLWNHLEQQIKDGFFILHSIPSTELHEKARELSDKYTPTFATRSLDLIHVAAALLLSSKTFLTFDERQYKVALKEGFKTNQLNG